MSLLPITQGNSRTLALVNQWGHKGKLLSPNLKYVEDHRAHKGGLGAGEQNAPGGLWVPSAHRPWWLSQPPVVPNLSHQRLHPLEGFGDKGARKPPGFSSRAGTGRDIQGGFPQGWQRAVWRGRGRPGLALAHLAKNDLIGKSKLSGSR